ncbi:MAG: MFS transporter [Chloroflexi bacterium]|nr:MFS transporter [Chloroflexota bacterium]
MSPSPVKPRGGLLRHPNFLKLWTAETVSVFGSQISALAIPVVAITILHAQAFEVALLGTIEFLPFILFTLPAGAWVDRLRRRPIMIAGDLGRAAVLATIPIVYLLNPAALTIWQLYAVGFVAGTLTVFFDVSNQSYLPSIVERDELIEGNSKLQISASAAQIAGPGIAGVLIDLVKAPFAIVLDGLSFVWSAFFVWLIRKPEPPVEHPADALGEKRPSIVSDVRDGLRFVVGHPALRAISAGTGTSNLFGNIGGGILFLYLLDDRYLHLTAGQIGLAFGLGNVGALVGAVLANRIARWFGLGPTIVGSLFTGGFMMLLIAVAPSGEAALPFLVAGGVFGGLSQMVYNINQVSYRQAICPPRMQGRMNATVRFLVWGTIPIGNILGGLIATTFGVHETIWLAAVLGFVPAIFPLLSPVRSLRVMPEPVGDEPPSPGAAAPPAPTPTPA